jgi:YTH domain-containing family protein
MSADQELASGTGVRRHHTISASSRPARDPARSAIAEEGALSHDDDIVDEDWDGPVGAVGEKNAGLHRQASLPTSRHYVPRGPCGSVPF